MRKVTLGIDGMTCSSCSNTVENALRTAPGVQHAAVNLTTNTATVEYNSSVTSDKKLADEVESVGFGADVLIDEIIHTQSNDESSTSSNPMHSKDAGTIRTSVLGIEGMTCSSCSGTVESAIRSIVGVNVESVVVALSTNTATFQYDSKKTSAAAVAEEIESVGFGAEVLQDEAVVGDYDVEENGGKSGPAKGFGGKNSALADAGVIKTMLLLIEESPHTASDLNNGGHITAPGSVRSTGHSPLATGDRDSVHGSSAAFSAEDAEEGTITEASLTELHYEIQQLSGVQAAELRSADAQIKVTYDDFLVGPRDFHHLAAARGLKCTVCSLGGFMMATRLLKNQAKETSKLYAQLVLAASLTAPIFSITMILGMIPACKRLLATEIFPGLAVNGALLFLLSFPVQFYVGHQFHSKAWKSLKTGTLGMDFLVSTGTLAAYLYSSAGLIMGIVAGVPNMRDVEYFETSAVLITAVLLGKYLEVYAKGQTAAAIHKLSKLKAHTARLVTSGTPESTESAMLSAQGEDSDRLIDAALLHRRDIVRLVAGETVPADGELLGGGHVGVDEAMMTGESALVAKGERDTAYGGTMVIEGSALMRVTACGDDSTLGRIISTVQQAQASKPPIQELADRVARYFVPVIALTSLCTFAVWIIAYWAGGVPAGWYEAAGNPYLFAFFFALAVWVSACPCAFGLATPTAVLVATGVAAKHGILIRKGAALQYASNVNVVAFDKTGTLTKGSTEVTDFLYRTEQVDSFGPLQLPEQPHSPARTSEALTVSIEARYLLQLMHLAECRSSHPLAKGITAFCKTNIATLDRHIEQSGMHHSAVDSTKYSLPLEQSLMFDVIPGLGIRMYTPPEEVGALKIPPVDVLVGSGKLLQSMHVPISAEAAARASSYRAGGKVAVYVSLNGVLRAIVGVSDAVRPEAAHVIRALHSRGIACYMITGDEATTAHAIAQAVGIPSSRILARAKPEDKKAFIEALQTSHLSLPSHSGGHSGKRRNRFGGKKLNVAFVGDGTNDSPALAVAEVGFTMASGSDIAVEAGDMVLCKNDLQALLIALDLSQQTMRRIQINYFWALCYNACLVPVAAGVLYPAYHFALAPMLAGMAMALSSVSIVVSSLWLARYQPPVLFGTEMTTSADKRSAAAAAGDHGQCDCPASSALEIAAEEPSPLVAWWRRLTGDSVHTRTTEEDLLTPAQWRQAQQVGAAVASLNTFTIDDVETEGDGDGDYAAVPFADDSEGASYSVLHRILGAFGLRNAGHSKRSDHADYLALDNPARGDGDVELGVANSKSEYKYDSGSYSSTLVRRNASGENVHGTAAIVKGCGCGKGNCKCGNSCMCGDVSAKVPARVK